MEITKRYSGAGFPQIFMDGELKPVTAILGGSLLADTGIVDQLYVERRAAGLVHTTDFSGDWYSTYAPDVRKNGIYVPSLAELGYPVGYSLEASAGVTLYANVGSASTTDIRLVDYATNFPAIAGTNASKAISASAENEFIQSGFVAITGGKQYMVDFKTGENETVGVRVMTIHLRIVKT